MSNIKTISPSQLNAFDCRLAWYWGYHEGYRGIRSSTALELGTGIHSALEMYYSKGGDPEEAFASWAKKRVKQMEMDGAFRFDDDREGFEKAIILGSAMMANYREDAKEKDDFKVLFTERMLARRLPIPGKEGSFSKVKLRARLDMIIRDQDSGSIYAVDFKTFSRFSLSEIDRNFQFSTQIWLGQTALQESGIDDPITGFLYIGLRKQAPGPRVKLALVERHKFYKTDHEIEVMLHRSYWTYRSMSHPALEIYPNPGPMRCGSCDFKEVCLEYIHGGDYQFLLDTLYTKR